jgi:hypothetical protein
LQTGRNITSTGGAVTGGRLYFAFCKPDSVLVDAASARAKAQASRYYGTTKIRLKMLVADKTVKLQVVWLPVVL